MSTELLYNTGVSRTLIKDKLGKFDNVITIAKTGHGDFVCSDSEYASDAACVNAAFDYLESIGGGELKFMAGHYACGSQIAYAGGDIVISGQGGKTVLDFSTAPATPSAFIYISGAVTTTNSVLSANAARGALTVTVATGEGSKFSTGDWIKIRSSAVWRVFNDAAPYGVSVGEIQQVASVSGDVLTLKEYLNGSYNTSDTATVDLLTMRENITIRDLQITGPPGVYHSGIYIKNAAHVNIENVLIEDSYYTGIALRDVVDASIDKNTIKRSTKEGEGYGLAVFCASRNISGSENNFNDCRHGIMCGSDDYAQFGVQYNQTYIGNKMSHNPHAVGMFGPHPTYSGIVAIGNVCSGGCALGFFNGPNNIVANNFVEMSKSVAGIYLPECCENTIVQGNIIHSAANHGIMIRSKSDTIDISNNQIFCYTAGFDGVSAANNVNKLKVVNNRIESLGSGINVTTYEGTANSDDVSIKKNTIVVTGSSEAGITITTSTYNLNNIRVHDNDIKTSSTVGIEVDGGTGTIDSLSIKDNDIQAPAKAIYVYNAGSSASMTNAVINNNECRGGTIDIDGINGVDVKINHMYNTPADAGAITIHGDVINYHVTDNDFTNCTLKISNAAGITGRILMNNIGYNPVGFISAPGIPTSGTANKVTNNYGYPIQVMISGGTVTAITVNDTATGLTSGTVTIMPGDTISLTYSVAPTWKWKGM